MKIKKEYTIALMVLAGIGLLIFGINFLKGLDMFQKRNVFHALYSDVSGINESTPVYYNGFKVGQVISTELMPDLSGRIAVGFQLNEKGLLFPKDTKVQIYSADLFSRSLKLLIGESNVQAEPGDTLTGDVQMTLTDAVSSQIDPLKKRAESMIANVDSLLTRLQMILNEEARDDIDAGFTSIRKTLDALHRSAERIDALILKQSATIGSAVQNIEQVTANLVAYDQGIVRIINNLDSVTTTLARGDLDSMLINLNESSTQLKVIMDRMEKGEGTMGALLKNDTLYNNLESASRELDMLLEDVRLNPNRYVNISLFGKNDKMPKLSNSDVDRIKQSIHEEGGK
ncbi:MAG: MlaD family protein [Bacteroidota bacterium]|nr:MlaD family protein [Bacteroidota bacterium]